MGFRKIGDRAAGAIKSGGTTRRAAKMVIVDADHLLADPIYDPARCSIGFHPLHTHPAIVSYVSLLAGGLYVARISKSAQTKQLARWGWLVALGLLIHMALDALDCVV